MKGDWKSLSATFLLNLIFYIIYYVCFDKLSKFYISNKLLELKDDQQENVEVGSYIE